MLKAFLNRYEALFPDDVHLLPWDITVQLERLIQIYYAAEPSGYHRQGTAIIHRTATVEENVQMKGTVLIGPHCTIGANAYLRGPLLLDERVHIGAGCEIKQSILLASTAIAHFNYIGNSVIGSNVNFEAGSVAANHFNEREDKMISVLWEGKRIPTGITKFGSLVGDDSRIGANAVLSPGTILPSRSIVGRLQLIDQSS